MRAHYIAILILLVSEHAAAFDCVGPTYGTWKLKLESVEIEGDPSHPKVEQTKKFWEAVEVQTLPIGFDAELGQEFGVIFNQEESDEE